MRSNVMRVRNYWSDVLVRVEGRRVIAASGTQGEITRVVWVLKDEVWPQYGVVFSIEPEFLELLVPL